MRVKVRSRAHGFKRRKEIGFPGRMAGWNRVGSFPEEECAGAFFLSCGGLWDKPLFSGGRSDKMCLFAGGRSGGRRTEDKR